MDNQPFSSPDPEPHDDPVYGPAYGPSDGPVYGRLEPAPRRFPRLAVAGGLMAALALGGAGIAYAAGSGGSAPATPAASSSPSTTAPTNNGSSNTPPGKAHRGFGADLGLPGLGLPGLGGRVLYGSATIQQPDGTLKTVEYQSGTVSAVSTGSITVVSGNNNAYTHTYKVDPSTVVDSQAGGINTVAKGDQVRIIATQQNGSDTAANIVDVTKIKSSRTGFGFGAGKDGNQGPAGTATNPPAGSTGAIWGGPGPDGPGAPGGSVSGSTEAQ